MNNVIIHRPCGSQMELHPATAELVNRCPNWYQAHLCSKCGYQLVDTFSWQNGQSLKG